MCNYYATFLGTTIDKFPSFLSSNLPTGGDALNNFGITFWMKTTMNGGDDKCLKKSKNIWTCGTGLVDASYYETDDRPSMAPTLSSRRELLSIINNSTLSRYLSNDQPTSQPTSLPTSEHIHDFGVSLYGGKIAFGVRSTNTDNTYSTLTSSGKVNDGNWHHIWLL